MTGEATTVEIEAAARALSHHIAGEPIWDGDGERWEEFRNGIRSDARAALAAALPLVEARLREQIAADIEAMEPLSKDDPLMVDKVDAAGVVRRGQ